MDDTRSVIEIFDQFFKFNKRPEILKEIFISTIVE